MNSIATQSEFAALRGVRKSAVSNWKTKGLLVFTADPDQPGKQLVDVAKSNALIDRFVDQHRGRPNRATRTDAAQPAPMPSIPAPAMSDARTDLLREQVIRERLRNLKAAEELVLVDEFASRSADLARRMRERLHAFLRGEAERIAAERDPRQVLAILSAGIDEQLDTVADELEREAAIEAAAEAADALDEPDDLTEP